MQRKWSSQSASGSSTTGDEHWHSPCFKSFSYSQTRNGEILVAAAVVIVVMVVVMVVMLVVVW
jgi:hypothetical protein